MKIERVIKLEDYEIDALKTLANMDCSGAPCHDCKFKLKADGSNYCLLIAIRSFLTSQEITWRGV